MKRISKIITLITFLIFAFFGCSKTEKQKQADIFKKVASSVVIVVDKEKFAYSNSFFLNKNGDIITKSKMFHGRLNLIEIMDYEGKFYPISKMIAEDKDEELIRLAVKIPQSLVKPLSISTTHPKINDPVYVVYCPGWSKEKEKVISGVVTAFHTIPSGGEIIEIKAPTLSGSIGSPVVSAKGEVIGFINEQTDGKTDINYLLPLKQVQNLVPDLFHVGIIEQLKSDGLYRFGKIMQQTDRSLRAIVYFQDAVEKNPSNAKAHFEIGNFHYELENYNWALKSYRLAVLLNPNDHMANNTLEQTLALVQKYENEIEAYKQATYVNSNAAEPFCKLCRMYSSLGSYNQAIEHGDEALRIDPNYPQAHYYLGLTYVRLNNKNLAYKEYDSLLKLDPQLADNLLSQIHIR